MCDTFKEEFKIQKFEFFCPKPESLYKCQWKWHPAIYLTFRILTAVYSLGALITVCVMSIGNDRSIMVYLTIWTFTLLTIHLWLASAITILYGLKKPLKSKIHGIENPEYVSTVSGKIEESKTSSYVDTGSEEHGNNIPWFLKLSWLLANIVQVFEILVTIIYFGFLYGDMENRDILFNDLNMHAMNSVFVVLDFCVSARPVHFLHFVQPAIYGIIYTIFSVVYWTHDHENNVIYSVLNWNDPGFAVGLICSLAFVIIPIFQLIYYGLYRMRLRLFAKLYNESYF